MKKNANIFILLFISLIALTACSRTYAYRYEEPIDAVENILFVDEKSERPVEKEDFAALLQDIQNLPCQKYWNDPCQVLSYPYILVEYSDGSCEAISSSANYYKAGGTTDYGWEYFDPDSFSAILEKYE